MDKNRTRQKMLENDVLKYFTVTRKCQQMKSENSNTIKIPKSVNRIKKSKGKILNMF